MHATKPKPIQKILILRFSSIGDIVLTTPVLRCLKRKYPEAEIHYLVKKQFKSVIADNPYIDVIHTLEEDLQQNIAALKALKFDVVIDLHNNLRTMRVKKALKLRQTYTFSKLNTRKWLYTNLKWNTLPPISIVARYFEAIRPLGVMNDGLGLDFFIPEDKETKREDIPMGHWMGYVACVIGGSFETKQFPVAKWKTLVAECPYPVILLGGPDDAAMATAIEATDPVKIYNACGKFSLVESADLVKKARVVITNDTGLMHIGAAFQKKMITLWGNTTPWLGMFPYYGANDLETTISPLFTIAEVNNLSCRPCSKIGYHECPKKHFRCMNDINIAQILVDLDAFWKA
ncbi:glycosyl transferase [Taibaiella sp. KBW10]|nr:glycosyl transferase [Taibaiella sp. KBW10]